MRKLEQCHNIMFQTKPKPERLQEYEQQDAPVIASLMSDIHLNTLDRGVSFLQQYILPKGLKVFKEKGSEPAYKEVDQLHRCNSFSPITIKDMTLSERAKAVDALMFLAEKKDGSIKGRQVYNGKPTREWMGREDTSSPTVSMESTFLTGVIDTYEKRDMMSCDVPNAFIQTDMPIKEGRERE